MSTTDIASCEPCDSQVFGDFILPRKEVTVIAKCGVMYAIFAILQIRQRQFPSRNRLDIFSRIYIFMVINRRLVIIFLVIMVMLMMLMVLMMSMVAMMSWEICEYQRAKGKANNNP